MNSYNDKETLSTLRFGYRAKSIKNKPVVNNEKSAKELILKLNEAEEKIKTYESLIQDLQLQADTGQKRAASGLKTILTTNNNNVSTEISSFRGERNAATLSSRCEDCGNAMVKILNQHIEIVNLQEELELSKNEKTELEEEIQRRNEEIYELNEKILMNELQSKLFIDGEVKSFQDVQNRLENIFLNNQKKLIETNTLRNLLEKVDNDVGNLVKNIRNKLSTKQDETLNLELGKLSKLIGHIEESSQVLSKLENYIYKDNSHLSEIVDTVNKKTNVNLTKNLGLEQHYSYVQPNYLTENVNSKLFETKYQSYLKKISRRSRSLNERSNTLNKLIQQCDISLQAIEEKNRLKPRPTKVIEEDRETNRERAIKNKLKLDFSKIRNKESQQIKKKAGLEDSNNQSFEKNIIHSQRKTILNMSQQIQQLKDQISQLQAELKNKEDTYYKVHETVKKQVSIIEQNNERMRQLELQNVDKDKLFEEYKERSLQDFAYKENQILELHNKISDLEDEKFRLVHFSKDKDKKKFLAMETQIKQFTNELQKLTLENTKLKQINDKKEDDIKHLNDKVADLEAKLMVSLKNKMKSPIEYVTFKEVSTQ